MECQFIVESIIERSHDRCEQINFDLGRVTAQNNKIKNYVTRLQELLGRLNLES